MISIRLLTFVSISLFACAVSLLRGETISFPKENPAFTFELPKDLKAEFDKPDHLVFNGGSFYLFETKVRDKEAAKKALDAIISVPCERVQAQRIYKEPASEIKEPSGLLLVGATCIGSYDEGPNLSFRSRIISLDGKRFFEIGFYLDGQTERVEAMLKSVKPVTTAPTPAASPQK